MANHNFVDSGKRSPAKDGRLLRICEVCGQTNIGTRHGMRALTAEEITKRHGEYKPKPKPVVIVPRAIRLLALTLDEVIDLPMDVVGMRTWVRANDLRASLTDVPRDPQTETVTIPKFEPVPMPKGARHSAPVKARARVATKGIRHQFMREVANAAIEQGWQLERTGTGHYRLGKEGKHIVFAATTSDQRAWRNFKATAKRHGINVEGIG